MELINDIIRVASSTKVSMVVEKLAQQQLAKAFEANGIVIRREYRLDKDSIPDFFDPVTGVAVELKIKGSKMEIYRQCERYCKFDQVKALILCSSKAVGLPSDICGKPTFFVSIGRAWL